MSDADCMFGELDGTLEQADVILDYVLEHGFYSCGKKTDPGYWDITIVPGGELDDAERGTIAWHVRQVMRRRGVEIVDFVIYAQGLHRGHAEHRHRALDQAARSRGGQMLWSNIESSVVRSKAVREVLWEGFDRIPTSAEILDSVNADPDNDPGFDWVDRDDPYVRAVAQRFISREMAKAITNRAAESMYDHYHLADDGDAYLEDADRILGDAVDTYMTVMDSYPIREDTDLSIARFVGWMDSESEWTPLWDIIREGMEERFDGWK